MIRAKAPAPTRDQLRRGARADPRIDGRAGAIGHDHGRHRRQKRIARERPTTGGSGVDLPEAVTVRGLAAAQRVGDPGDEPEQEQERRERRPPRRRLGYEGDRDRELDEREDDADGGRRSALERRSSVPPGESPRDRGACRRRRRRRRPRGRFAMRARRWTSARSLSQAPVRGGAGRDVRLYYPPMLEFSDEVAPHQIAFEAFGVAARVCSNSRELLAQVEPLMPPGWRSCPSEAASQRLGILREEDGTYSVFKGAARVSQGQGLQLSLVVLEGQLRGYVALNSPDKTFIHAGAVAAASARPSSLGRASRARPR